jgi:diphthamide biosynthesis enzyme Dph1/Dph2-like protein
MEKFEIHACHQWIEENHFTRIALQVPDEDLDKVHDLIDSLRGLFCSNEIEFFVVGDGCSSCCNDLINAQYCQAQGLIHFGHSCLTTSIEENSPKIEIYYVFYQRALPYVIVEKNSHSIRLIVFTMFRLSRDETVSELSKDHQATDKPYTLIFYDPCYRNAIEQYSNSSHLIISKLMAHPSTDELSLSVYGRSVQLPVPLTPSMYSIIFISHSQASMHNFTLYFYAYEFR